MPTHTLQTQTNEVYFCTLTCNRWLNLFDIAEAYDEVYKWFNYLITKDQCDLLAYVIMPNHLHLVLYYRNKKRSLNKIVAEGKRFMAYGIVKNLKLRNEEALLYLLQNDVPYNERGKGKKHHVFKPSFDAKLCFSKEMCETKVDYVHDNPVKAGLVDDCIRYKHSSSGFYEAGAENELITDYVKFY